jgi:predicted metal-dependent phosphoesterase TrpH
MQKLAPFTVIVAEEILTTQGEIMGMFLKETVSSGLTPQESIKRIRAQDGLVNIPHPFEKIRGSALKDWVIEEIVDEIDLMEVLNSRTPFQSNTEKARDFAEKHHIIKGAGSDAHTVSEIGNAYLEMPEFNGKDEFLKSLAQASIYGHRSSPLAHIFSTWARIKTKIKKGE